MSPLPRPRLHLRANRADIALPTRRGRRLLHVERLESRAVLTAAMDELPFAVVFHDIHDEPLFLADPVVDVWTNSSTTVEVTTGAMPPMSEMTGDPESATETASNVVLNDPIDGDLSQAIPITIAGASSTHCGLRQLVAGNATTLIPLDAPSDLQAGLSGMGGISNCFDHSIENEPSTDASATVPGDNLGPAANTDGAPFPSSSEGNGGLSSVVFGGNLLELVVANGQSSVPLYQREPAAGVPLTAPSDTRSVLTVPLNLHRPLYESPPVVIATASSIPSAGIELTSRQVRPEPSVAAVDRFFSAMRAVPLGTSSLRIDVQHDPVLAQPLVRVPTDVSTRAVSLSSDTMSSLALVAHRSEDVVSVIPGIRGASAAADRAASVTVRLPENPFRRVLYDASARDRHETRSGDQKASRRVTMSLPMSEELWRSMLALGAGLCIYSQQSATRRDDDGEADDSRARSAAGMREPRR